MQFLRSGQMVALSALLIGWLVSGCSPGGSQPTSPAIPAASQHISTAASQNWRRLPAWSPSVSDVNLMKAAHPAGSLRIVDPSTAGASLYVASSYTTAIAEYGARATKPKHPKCTISLTGLVNSIGVDDTGTLWVPQQGGTFYDIVTSYAPHCGAPGIILSDYEGAASSVASDSAGTNYVGDAFSAYGLTVGDVEVFPAGQTQASTILTSSVFGVVTGVAVDPSGNVYASSFSGKAGHAGSVTEFVGGQEPGQVVLSTSNPLIDLLFDKKANLIVVFETPAQVEVFAPPYTGSPKETFPLQAFSNQCSLNKSEKMLACADGPLGTVDFYTYPNGAYQYSFVPAEEKPNGIAFDPATKL